MCLAFSPKPRKAQAFCFTITLNENVKLIWYISVQPENGSWSAPLANSHPEARGTCWPQSCNIYVFQTQTGASWPEKTNVPMETWRDSLRKPRIDHVCQLFGAKGKTPLLLWIFWHHMRGPSPHQLALQLSADTVWMSQHWTHSGHCLPGFSADSTAPQDAPQPWHQSQ